MAVVYNLARMSTATEGTGTMTLLNAVAGFLTFALAGVSDGDIVSYGIVDGAASEVGRGTYTATGTTLTRSVLKSTNSDAAIDLSGSAEVTITILKEDLTDIVEDAAFGAGWNGDTIHAPSQNAVYDKFVTADVVAALNTTHRGSSGADHAYLDQAVTIAGTPTFGGVTVNGPLFVDGQANVIQALFQGVAGQTADIVVAEASDGYDWFVVEADGQVRISSTEQEVLRVHRNTNSGNAQMALVFQADDDEGAISDYAKLSGSIQVNTAGSESGRFLFSTMVAGTYREQMRFLSTGVIVNNSSVEGNDFVIKGVSLDRMFWTDASPATENIALVAAAAPNWQTMDRGLFIGDTSQVPTGNPANGGFLYVEAGALTYRGSGGTITVLGAA